MSRVFLSHSSRDRRQAIAVKRWLEESDPGLAGEIFLDVDAATGLRAGTRWTEALWQANTRCEAVICLTSEDWVASKECHAEFRQAEGMGKPVFIARLEEIHDKDVTRAWQSCSLFGPGQMVAVQLDDGEPAVQLALDGLQRLLTGLRAVGVGADSFPWPPAHDPGRSPYRGWQPLESVDAAVYFGRDAQIVRALDELRELRDSRSEQLFVILGASGVGKSSFLRAGILPRLERDDRRFVTMDIVRPERRALTGSTGLAHSIHTLRAELGLGSPSLGDLKSGISDVTQVRRWLTEAQVAARDRMVAPTDQMPTLVLPIDQAEELFGVDAAEGPDFLHLLNALLGDSQEGPDLIAVATIRSDRYEPLQNAPQLSSTQTHPFDRLKAMPQAQFTEVICGPARRAAETGSTFELTPELVDRLSEDASAGADTLPLLALMLARLYEDYAGSDSPIGIAQYDAMGGMRRVVQNEIDSLLAADPTERSEQLRQLHDAFIPWLATVNADTDQPMRRIARWADLPENSHALLDAFIARRLLVKGKRGGEVVVEVALESLLAQWDELAGWLDAERTDLREADGVERANVAWERSGRHDDWLLDGTRLTSAETLCAKTGFSSRLAPSSEFLLASRRCATEKLEAAKSVAEEHARSLRRRAQILGALLVVIVVIAALAFYGLARARSAEHEARRQTAQAIAAKLTLESRAMLNGTRAGGDRRAIMQMLAAEKLAPGRDPGALLDTVYDTRDLRKIIAMPSVSSDVAISPDGREAITGGEDDVVRRWDLRTGAQIGEPLSGHTDDIEDLAVAMDLIASVSQDRTVRVWDAETGQAVSTIRIDDEAWNVALSPDGTLLATGTRGGIVQFWNPRTGSRIGGPIDAHGGLPVSDLEFSPDGTLLASGGFDGRVQLWNVATRAPAPVPGFAHKGMVTGIAFDGDGRRLATTGYIVDTQGTSGHSAELRVTELPTGRASVERTIKGVVPLNMAFSPNGNQIAIATADSSIQRYDANNGAPVGEPLTGATTFSGGVAYSSDSGSLVSTAGDSLRVYSADPDQPVGHHLDASIFAGASAISPDGRVIATPGLADPRIITLMQIDGAETLRNIQTGTDGVFRAPAFSADSRLIAVATRDNVVRIWDANTGAPVGPPLTGAHDRVAVLAFSRDGSRIAAGTFDGTALVWRVGSAANPERELTGNAGAVTTLGFDADGSRLLVVSQYHFEDGSEAGPAGELNPAESQRIVTPSSARVWDLNSGDPAGPAIVGRGGLIRDITLDQKSTDVPISSASLSPDGDRLLVSTINELGTRDVATGQAVGNPWQGQNAQGASIVAFSPDGRFAVTSEFTTSDVQMWDALTGRPIGPVLRRQPVTAVWVAIGADNNVILSKSGAGDWIIWPGPSAWYGNLCDKLSGDITEAEWSEWVSPDIDYQKVCPADARS